MNTKDWIITWFTKNTVAHISDIEKNTRQDYFVQNWIDSLKFITLITDIEEHFHIVFANDEFQNREFSTIDGLVKIIEGKINDKI
jgi:acyl carrier protein